MKKFITLVLRLAQIFMGLITFYSFIMLMLYNKPLKFFDFTKTRGEIIEIKEQKNDICLVTYKYKANNRVIISKSRIYKKLLNKNDQDLVLDVEYNRTFPSINRINNINMYEVYYLVLGWGLFMLTIFILIDLFADKEKWAERYSRFLGLK